MLSKNQGHCATCNKGGRDHVPQPGNADENDQHHGDGGNGSANASTNRYLRDVDLWIRRLVQHGAPSGHKLSHLLPFPAGRDEVKPNQVDVVAFSMLRNL